MKIEYTTCDLCNKELEVQSMRCTGARFVYKEKDKEIPVFVVLKFQKEHYGLDSSYTQTYDLCLDCSMKIVKALKDNKVSWA